MQAKLQLPFVKQIGVLLHVTELQLGLIGQSVAEAAVEPISIVVVDFPAIANIALTIHKQLVL